MSPIVNILVYCKVTLFIEEYPSYTSFGNMFPCQVTLFQCPFTPQWEHVPLSSNPLPICKVTLFQCPFTPQWKHVPLSSPSFLVRVALTCFFPLPLLEAKATFLFLLVPNNMQFHALISCILCIYSLKYNHKCMLL